MHHYRLFVSLIFVITMVCLTGCGPKGPRVNHVEGIVTLDGQPVEGATVSFVPPPEANPNDLTAPLWAVGRTDSEGKYTLSTTQGSAVDAGTTVGQYNVRITKQVLSNPLTGQMSRGYVPKFEDVIPVAFGTSSPIDVEVVKGKNVFNFNLKSDGTFEVTK